MTNIVHGYFDGSCSNPRTDGDLGYGYHANLEGKSQGTLLKVSEGGGIGTNNEAELIALYKLLVALSKKAPNSLLIIRGDSMVVINFMNGVTQPRNPRMRKLVEAIKPLENHFTRVVYQHIPREKNKLADSLSKRSVQRKLVDYYKYKF